MPMCVYMCETEWYRHGDLNPGYQDENLASWTRLDDGGVYFGFYGSCLNHATLYRANFRIFIFHYFRISSMPLKVTHYEKGYTYTASELLILAKKIGRLSRYCRRMCDEGSSIKVETISRDTKKQNDAVKVMITIHLPKRMLRAESRRPQALDAIDRCCEKLESQIKKYKAMHTRMRLGRRAERRTSRS
jgi:ribosomal subunit interface protein